MTKELMIRKHYIPNFSNASCSLSAFILEGENKGTLRTLDVIFRKIIKILVQFICLLNAKFFQFRIALLWEDFSDQSLLVTWGDFGDWRVSYFL